MNAAALMLCLCLAACAARDGAGMPDADGRAISQFLKGSDGR